MSSLATDADAVPAPSKVFLSLTQHRLALRPDIVVVEGMRGAGKTALFKLVNQLGPRVRDFFEDNSIPAATWLDGFSEEQIHPPPATLDEFVRKLDSGRDSALRAFWVTHLLARLVENGVPGAAMPNEIGAARERSPHEITGWVDVAEQRIGLAMAALDAVDAKLASKKAYVFVSYDYLDRLGLLESTRSTRQRLIRALVALWLSNSTRLRHLRGKIFLRPDLFEEAERSFPDASKLRPRSVSLNWDVESLYRLLARHLANSGPTPDVCRTWLKSAGLELKDHPAGSEYGFVPGEMPPDVQAQFATKLAGQVMGSGAKKGYTHRWIPARLKDAEGRIVPRSLLRLIGYAARDAHSTLAGKGKLMEPTHLMDALKETSRDRVNELKEEYPFVARLSNLSGETMLMEKRIVVTRLSRAPEVQDGFATDGVSVLDELLRIGVIEIRDDGRIDVPDIYRYGYGIKRKGGAAARR